MAALIRQEKERQAANEDEDIDDFWKDEKDDDEYSGSAESEHERRDVFDSDFDEDESESARGVPVVLWCLHLIQTTRGHLTMGPFGPRREKCAAQVRGGGLGF